MKEEEMKRTWLVWTLVGGVLVTVLIAFNYERGKETVPLSEIFPGKGTASSDVEYEFFDTDEKGSALVTTAETKQTIRPVPAVSSVSPKLSAGSASVEQITASSGAVERTPSAGAGKIYTIQVAAFKERVRADKAVAQAQQKGYSAYIDEQKRGDGSIWYQICIGKFDAQGPAKELLMKIKQDYKDGFIKILSGK